MVVKILVVDDDQRTREALAAILWRAGYEVTLLESGKHLEKNLLTHTFAAAVIDFHLPERNGLEIARSIKASLPGCPVLLISSEVPPLQISDEKTTPVNRFLSKPFSKAAFLQVISELCPLAKE